MQGQREFDRQPTFWIILGPDAPTMRLNDTPADSQAEAGSVHLLGHGIIRAVETLEDP
jgi:hypothetical protein